MVRPTLEHVTGATAIWMAKRRGHKKIVKYLRDQRPEVQEALHVFKVNVTLTHLRKSGGARVCPLPRRCPGGCTSHPY